MGKARRRKRYGSRAHRAYRPQGLVFKNEKGAPRDKRPKDIPAEKRPGRNGDRTWRSVYEFLDGLPAKGG